MKYQHFSNYNISIFPNGIFVFLQMEHQYFSKINISISSKLFVTEHLNAAIFYSILSMMKGSVSMKRWNFDTNLRTTKVKKHQYQFLQIAILLKQGNDLIWLQKL